MGALPCRPCTDGLGVLLKGKASSGGNTVQQKRAPTHVSLTHILPNNSGQRPQDTYNIQGEAVGTGAFGTVRKATSKRTGMVCALKTIDKGAITSLAAFLNEVSLNASLDHPNIVRLYETFEDSTHVYLVMEMCRGGEMFDMIIEQGHFSEIDAARLLKQILRAVSYMHSQGIAHRDLKPENFLLQERGVDIAHNTLKVIDFGIAARFTQTEGQPEGDLCLRTKAGTAYYVAPEVLSGRYNEKCDVWSCGVILYILLSGSPPFSGETDAQTLAAVKAGKLNFSLPEFGSVSAEAKQLILRMCTLNPRLRPTAAEVLNTRWVQQPKAILGEGGAASLLSSKSFLQKLQSLSSVSRFKKAALMVIANRLDDGEIKKLRNTFLRLDKDGDGTLTLEEVRAACAEAGVTNSADVLDAFSKLDFDHSGSIGYREFLAAMIDQKSYLQEELCWEAFRVFDRDNSGHISFEEFRLLLAENGDLKELCEAEAAALFRDGDQDGDGQISFPEFMAMMRKSA